MIEAPMFSDKGRDGSKRGSDKRPKPSWFYKIEDETYITKHHPDWVRYDGTFETTLRHRD